VSRRAAFVVLAGVVLLLVPATLVLAGEGAGDLYEPYGVHGQMSYTQSAGLIPTDIAAWRMPDANGYSESTLVGTTGSDGWVLFTDWWGGPIKGYQIDLGGIDRFDHAVPDGCAYGIDALGSSVDPVTGVETPVIVRFDGRAHTIDTGFGQGGFVTDPSLHGAFVSVATISDNGTKLLFVGRGQQQGDPDFLVEYDPWTKQRVASFGDQGVVRIDLHRPVALLNLSNRLIIGASKPSQMIAVTYQGAIDQTFGQGGFVLLPDASSPPVSLSNDRDGNLFAFATAPVEANTTGFEVARYSPNGAPLGSTVAAVIPGQSATAVSGYLYSGTIFAQGSTSLSDGRTQPGVVRFTLDGTVDTSFADGGHAVFDFGNHETDMVGSGSSLLFAAATRDPSPTQTLTAAYWPASREPNDPSSLPTTTTPGPTTSWATATAPPTTKPTTTTSTTAAPTTTTTAAPTTTTSTSPATTTTAPATTTSRPASTLLPRRFPKLPLQLSLVYIRITP
jgi:hypothetical protein